jgi:hypothetical protein
MLAGGNMVGIIMVFTLLKKVKGGQVNIPEHQANSPPSIPGKQNSPPSP